MPSQLKFASEIHKIKKLSKKSGDQTRIAVGVQNHIGKVAIGAA